MSQAYKHYRLLHFMDEETNKERLTSLASGRAGVWTQAVWSKSLTTLLWPPVPGRELTLHSVSQFPVPGCKPVQDNCPQFSDDGSETPRAGRASSWHGYRAWCPWSLSSGHSPSPLDGPAPHPLSSQEPGPQDPDLRSSFSGLLPEGRLSFSPWPLELACLMTSYSFKAPFSAHTHKHSFTLPSLPGCPSLSHLPRVNALASTMSSLIS